MGNLKQPIKKNLEEGKKQPAKPQQIKTSKEQLAGRAKNKAELERIIFAEVKDSNDQASKRIISGTTSTLSFVHSFHQKKPLSNGKAYDHSHNNGYNASVLTSKLK